MREKIKVIKDKIDFQKILEIYIVLQFAIDIITAFCIKYVNENLTLGVFIRTAFMILIVLYALIKAEKKDKIKMLVYYSLLGIYILAFLFLCHSKFGFSMILTQGKSLLKVFYLPVILTALLFIFKKNSIKIENKFFIYSLLGYTGTILLAKITGLANPTYPLGNGAGTTGFFFAANEIGIIMSILAGFLVYELLNNKINLINIITLLVYIYASLEIGTKVPLLSLIILLFISTITALMKIFRKESRKNGLFNLIAIIVTFIVVIVAVPYTPSGVNIQNNYGISFNKIFTKNQTCQTEEVPQKTFESEEEVTTAVYSSRNLFFDKNKENFNNGDMSTKLIGLTYLENKEDTVDILKLIEIDFYDIFFCQGIIGTIIFAIPLLSMAVIILIKVFKNIKKLFFNYELAFLAYSICISLVVAFTAGHTLTSPAACIILAIAIIKLFDLVNIDRGD